MAGRLYLVDQGASYTAKAVETISGGQIVMPLSGATVLSSTNTINDVAEVQLVDASNQGFYAAGVALNTGVSGDYIGVSTEGIHGFYASAAVGAGSLVYANGAVTSADAVANMGLADDSGHALLFGRALSSAASGQLVAVILR